MHILITRPETDAHDWRTRLEAAGAAVTVDPLLTITLMPPDTLDLDGVQALIATSRNGLRGLAAASQQVLADALTHPIFVVGPGTGALARAMGFATVHEGPASARDLLPFILATAKPRDGALLHVCGTKLAFDLGAALAPSGYRLRRQIVYRSDPATALRPETIAALASGRIDTVVLTSPLSAKTFAALAGIAALNEPCQRLIYVCLSNGIADALAPLAPTDVRVADAPNSDAVFTLIQTLAAGRR